jgi:hypothetical protein
VLEETLLTFLLPSSTCQTRAKTYLARVFVSSCAGHDSLSVQGSDPKNVGVRCRVFPDDIPFCFLYSVHMFDARHSSYALAA